MILNALDGKPLPAYGDGQNVRDWLFVEDHCAAIRTVLERGRVGETYNIGGNSGRKNIDVVTTICDLVDEMGPVLPHGADHLCCRPAGPRSPLRNQREKDRRRAWLAAGGGF